MSTLTIIDIDYTLFETTAMVNVWIGKRLVRQLSSLQYAFYTPKSNERLDFSEFEDAKLFFETSVLIPSMFRKTKRAIAECSAAPLNRVLILTARGVVKPLPLFRGTFLYHGIDIDHPRVELEFAAGQHNARSKAAIIENYLTEEQHTRVRMYDDLDHNLSGFLLLKDNFPKVKFEAFKVINGKVEKFYETSGLHRHERRNDGKTKGNGRQSLNSTQ